MSFPSGEDVLLPLLKLTAGGSLTLYEAVRTLAPLYSLSASEQDELARDFSSSPFSALVSGAWERLSMAMLIESTPRPFCYTVSMRGRELLQRQPLRLTVNDLLQFPEFVHARDARSLRATAYSFRRLRFEYYAAGRLLLQSGGLTTAPTLLGYAIEYFLKAGFHCVNKLWCETDQKLVETNHDLSRLYQRARQLGLFTDTYISDDFLRYARDHFTRRYPSGERKLKRWSIGPSSIHVYDDCLCQLDDSLSALSGEVCDSVVYYALFEPRAVDLASQLFADNRFALSRARQLLQADDGKREPYCFLARLEEDPERKRRFEADIAHGNDLQDLQLAALYRYPELGEPDPDPLRNRYSKERDRSWPVDQLTWLLRRLREAFGDENVRVEEKRRPKGQYSALVFDRSARKWWRELILGDWTAVLGEWRRPHAEAALEAWIKETQAQFGRKRRNLRTAPRSDG